MRSPAALLLASTLALAACGGSDDPGDPPANVPPVAEAGSDQTVATGAVVALDGGGSSDPDGDALTYAWSFVSRPEGSGATLARASAADATFTADVDGAYVVQLVVGDGQAESAADTVNVTATTANVPPVADAGPDQAVAPGAVVALDGSGSSDGNGDALTYAWSFVSRPEGSFAELTGAEAEVAPSFTADLEGTYVVQLVVGDGELESAPDTVTVTATRPNLAPVADAGEDGSGYAGREIALDGRGSSDGDDDRLTFLWSFSSAPEGSAATIAGEDPSQPTFVPDVAGTYVVQLVVSDGRAESAPDTATFVVAPTYYDERFEASDGGYTHAGPGDVWEWGPPVGWPAATSGSCWGTNLDGIYLPNSSAALTSPVIDLTGLAPGTPLRLIWRQARWMESAIWDQATLDVEEGGVSIGRLWTATGSTVQQEWTELSADLTVAAGRAIQLEWRLITDSSINYHGLYVDDVMIVAGP